MDFVLAACLLAASGFHWCRRLWVDCVAFGNIPILAFG
uniref:Unidentified orf n=1 Tax=Human herpesvirus 8 TaxID=37296 RepID=Q98151_HHV8|nr:unidentified orf [Human gammaherpesvirus 8]